MKLKVASSTDDGRTFTVSGTSSKGTIGADLAVKQKFGPHTQTLKLLTAGSAQGELKLDGFGFDGLTSTLAFGVGKKVGTASLEYKQGRVGLTAAGDYYGKTAKGSFAGILSNQKMAGFAVIGAEGGCSADGTVENVAGAVSFFDGKESEVSVHVSDRGEKGKVSYAHQVRPDFAVAGQMEKSAKDERALLTLGVAAKLDGATTVKGKLDSAGRVALTYLQVIRPKTTLTLSTAFDVSCLKEASMGVSLAIE